MQQKVKLAHDVQGIYQYWARYRQGYLGVSNMGVVIFTKCVTFGFLF